MTEAQILQWFVFGLMGVAVWFMKNNITESKDRLTKLESELSSVKQNYLHRDDFKEFKVELRGMFEEIRKDIRSIKPQEH